MLKKWLSSLRNYLLFAGLGEENFRALYPKIKPQILADNRKNLNIFSVLASILFAATLVLSFVFPEFSDYRTLYAIMFTVSFVVFAFNRIPDISSEILMRIVVYLFIFATLLFSIILGTYYSPTELTATFFVLLIALPLLFVDRPHYFILMILASYVVYFVMALIYKDKNCITVDLANATFFGVAAITACVFSMNIKLQKIFLEYQNRVAGETDALTGLKNRAKFESTIQDFPIELIPASYFIYLDANGLHEMNDEFGHSAGDKMLCTVANIFREEFGESVFRIGGDEFVSIDTGIDPDTLAEMIAKMKEKIEGAGYHAAIGFEIGANASTLSALIKSAEMKMYEAKSEYYKATGKDRRKR